MSGNGGLFFNDQSSKDMERRLRRLETQLTRQYTAKTAAPATGYWNAGDLCFNSAPAVGSPMGWCCTVAGNPGTWVAMAAIGPGGGVTLSTVEGDLGADVTCTNGGQFYDGPSVSLGVGTWLLTGHVAVRGNTTNAVCRATYKLHNGSAIEDGGESTSGPTGAGTYSVVPCPVSGIVAVASGTETWKIAVSAGAGGSLILKNPVTDGTGVQASYLRAVQIGG